MRTTSQTSLLLLVGISAYCTTTNAFVVQRPLSRVTACTHLAATPPPEEDEAERTTFDQAGASLIEEEDRKRMEEMGDFDANPAYQDDSIAKMREAIRSRTQDLGMEKSKVSAEYIQARQSQALQSGAQADREQAAGDAMFGGVDLSKISNDGAGTTTEWDEDMPTMFYDPDDELTLEERQEVDPVMTKNVVEQGMNELTNAKWPTLGAAGREVIIMAAVVAFSGVLIIGADTVLRGLYTDVLKFIPSADELANYSQRFDGLDLPSGWMDNMSDNDMATLSDQVNTGTTTGTSTGLPSL